MWTVMIIETINGVRVGLCCGGALVATFPGNPYQLKQCRMTAGWLNSVATRAARIDQGKAAHWAHATGGARLVAVV